MIVAMLWLLLLGWLLVAVLVAPALGRLLASRGGELPTHDKTPAVPVDVSV